MKIKLDTTSAVAFLKRWPARPLMLSASHVDPATHKKGSFESKAFPEPVDWAKVNDWIESRQGRANVISQ